MDSLNPRYTEQSFELKHKISRMVCTSCAQEFSAEENLTRCPYDKALLAPVIDDPFIDTVLAEKYEILSILGIGGFAKVYKARHLALDRLVAIKILESHLVSNIEAVKRFEHEAKIVSQLVHRNIVAVLDYGLVPQPYLVMEYLDGETLEKLISRNPLPFEATLSIFRQICDGMESAHRHGAIHRDLKPSNIMLVKEADGSLTAKILDFGVAKLNADAMQSMSGLTKSGETLGSPPYMSPEQCQGRTPDARSDVYSLGCLLYEALSGEPPFGFGNAVELMHKHMVQAPPQLLFRHPNLQVPKPVEHLIQTSMTKDPQGRQQSMLMFKEDLDLSPNCTLEQFQKRVRARQKQSKVRLGSRHFVLLASAAALILLAVSYIILQSPLSGRHTDKSRKLDSSSEDAAFKKKVQIIEQLLRNGKTEQAMTNGNDLIRLYPQNSAAHACFAAAKLQYAMASEFNEGLVRQVPYQQAVLSADEAIKLDGQNIQAYATRIRANCRLGKSDLAEKDSKLLQVLAPDLPVTTALQALVLSYSGRTSEGLLKLDSLRDDNDKDIQSIAEEIRSRSGKSK